MPLIRWLSFVEEMFSPTIACLIALNNSNRNKRKEKGVESLKLLYPHKL